jgi:hypothetical protein
VADLATFGPATTYDAYRAWIGRAVSSGSHRGLILEQRETDWRNQGLGVVLSRWLSRTNYATHFDNEPRAQAQIEVDPPPPRYLNVVDLPPARVAQITNVIVLVSLGGLLWLARHPARRLSVWQLRLEWALFVLAMLWFMPVMRRYHMIWAFPILSVLCGLVHYVGGIRSRWSRLTLGVLLLTLLAQVSLLSTDVEALGLSAPLRAAEAAGAILACVALLAVPAVLMLLRLQRERSVPPPFFEVAGCGRRMAGLAVEQQEAADG